MTPPPGASYLTDLTWADALARCETIARQHPDAAADLLLWLAREARYALLGELPPDGPHQGWYELRHAGWELLPDEDEPEQSHSTRSEGAVPRR